MKLFDQEQKEDFFRTKFTSLSHKKQDSAKIIPYINPGDSIWYRPSEALIYPDMLSWLNEAHRYFDGDIKSYKFRYELDSINNKGWGIWVYNLFYGEKQRKIDF